MREDIKKRIEMIKRGEVPEGYKKTKVGIIPEDWKAKQLNQIVDVLAEKVGDRKIETLSISSGIGFVNQAEKFGKELSGKQYEKYIVLREDDFSYNKGNSKKYPQGCVYRLKQRRMAAVPNVFESFRFKIGYIDYFEQLFISGFLNKQLYSKINHGVRDDGLLNLTSRDFFETKIIFPMKTEQEKMARLLNSYDKIIELQQRLVCDKQKQKKWLMYNLLTNKIKLRSFCGKWKEENLGKFCKIKKGQQVNNSELLDKGNYYMLNGGMEPSGYVNEWNTKENTISISEGGNSCGYVKLNTEKFWSGGHCYILDDISDMVNTSYLYQILKYNESIIMELRVGSGLPNIQKKSLENYKVLIASIEEQKAIAKILSTADKEIELLKQKLDLIKLEKKAMMQLLLTGIVRVK